MYNYLTAPREDITREHLKEQYFKALEDSNLGLKLYIDTPFCMTACKFCNCRPYKAKCRGKEYNRYYEYLQDMLEFFSDLLAKHSATDIYFGGGTPTLMDTPTMKDVFSWIPNFVEIPNKAIECHPGLLSNSKIDLLKDVGFNYYSMGIQTFDEDLLKYSGRVGIDIESLRDKLTRLRTDDTVINIDLLTYIDGTNKENLEKLYRDLELCATLPVDIITPYFNFYSVNMVHSSDGNLQGYSKETYQHVLDYRRTLVKFMRKFKYISTYSFKEILDADKILGNILYAPEVFITDKRQNHNYSCSGYPHFSENQIALGLGGYETHITYGHIKRDFNYEMRLTDKGVKINTLAIT